VSYGAEVLPTFDPKEATHLVHCPHSSKITFLRQAKLKSLDDVPQRIPILIWDWVVRSHDAGKRLSYLDYARWREPPDEYEIDPLFAQKLKKAVSRRNMPALDDDGLGDGDLSRIS
jgi:hypothetical protein